MAENESNTKDRFGYLIAVVTIFVSIASLYYSAVQARVARQGFELTLNTGTANLEKQVAELQKKVGDQNKGQAWAEVLEHLSQVQTQIADQHAKFSDQRSEKELTELEKKLAGVQQELVRLQQDRDRKEQEVNSLRGTVARLEQEKSQPTTPVVVSLGKPPFNWQGLRQKPSLGSLNTGPSLPSLPIPEAARPAPPLFDLNSALKPLGTDPRTAIRPVIPTADENTSKWGGMIALLCDLWEVLKKHAAASIYFGVALAVIVGKLLNGK